MPRHIALKFMAIEDVTDVLPVISTAEKIEIYVLVGDIGYNHKTQSKILAVENEIREALRSKSQKFNCSISW